MFWLIIAAALFYSMKGTAPKLPAKPGEPAGPGTTPAGSDPVPELTCVATWRDGPYSICIAMVHGGKFAWTAKLDPSKKDAMPDAPDIVIPPAAMLPNEPNDLAYASREDALVGAWQSLSEIPIGARVVLSPITRNGLRLMPSGLLSVVDKGVYVNAASPTVSKSQMANTDAAGVVFDVLREAFGLNWNPLRVTINGAGLQAAVDRVAVVNPPSPPAVARAIMGIA